MKPLRAALAIVGVAALCACEIPTEAPILEQRWILPVESTTISVDELLPEGVSTAGSAFSVDVDAFQTSRTLGELCPTCTTTPVPVPAPQFNSTFSVETSLPEDVSSAVVSSGSVRITVQNDFSFDPAAGGGGVTITLTAGSGGRQLGEVVLSALPPGTTVQTLAIAPGDVGGTLAVTATVTSSGGQLTSLDTSDRITVTATPVQLLVGSATVDVAGELVDFDTIELDVEDIDSGIADRIQSGAIVLDVTNPFGVGVDATVVLHYPGGTLTRTVTIGAGATSTSELAYSGDDFRRFLGEPGVTLTGSGTVSTGAGRITVAPGQEVVIDGKIDVTLRIGD